MLDPQSLEIISRSPEQTRRVGMRLGALLHPGDLVCLIGDLGAGKTTLVQGVSAGWGSLDTANSPTFVLVNVYRRPDGGRMYHLDTYRLSGPAEAEDLDLDTLLENGPLLVEWADRVQAALPDERLWINLAYVDENQRDLLLSAHGPRYEAMLAELRRQVFGVE
ncbi:MAG: tRNA (adenosine(37)-N6)-threonylcarbamoyltransferase complex ATPase subunit type 1 TsaE [Chloroflexota bacterium]